MVGHRAAPVAGAGRDWPGSSPRDRRTRASVGHVAASPHVKAALAATSLPEAACARERRVPKSGISKPPRVWRGVKARGEGAG
eukprot:CAMPEP_0183354556 /NCGR_PEP_ID=MMETSP0164_2-20130417/37379_1 /TAXON_ID=221442 /ORGANISM="Coccolithus pelagicus ssp braarudi, Strain PLY182g" /LENGTH=82 /DNA_ID=CAMNT_0025527457 /DNA_START=472 /DNA_END=720 /DNA_ORIENTATION=+